MTEKGTQEQSDGAKCPKWRQYANFLHRELARLFYGKKSIFSIITNDSKHKEFWDHFDFIFAHIMILFGLEHGLTPEEMFTRGKNALEEYEKLCKLGFYFNSPYHEAYYTANKTLGEELAIQFLNDFQITDILVLIFAAFFYALKGKEPPYIKYVKGGKLLPLEFYENLEVDPELEAISW
jgi:hypothetical protein